MTTVTVAAVVHEAGAPFSLEDVELDEPRADEVLVRLVAAGLCHTDLSAQAGVVPFPLPGVLGHEGAGVVEAVGSAVRRVAPGDHVLASFGSCGRCPQCRGGHPAYCRDYLPLNLLGGARADGSHTIHQRGAPLNGHFFGQSSLARHALIDERCLVKVPSDAPLHILAPLGCGIQTGAGAILNVLRPEPGATVVVFGTGAVGSAAVMAAALSGAGRIVAVDLIAARLALARELGATDVVDASSADAVAAVRDLCSGGVAYAVEATGSGTALSQAIELLAPRGTCAILSTYRHGTTIPLDVNFMIDGRRVTGVSEGDSEPERFIPALARLHELGRLPIERLIRHYPFEQIEQAAADARNGTAIKPVLLFD
jgi:aryl-alcohol dehydrogenase